MTVYERCAYQGVYQAYAWQQGYADQPCEFRLPDENFSGDPGYEITGFNLEDFFRVVADIDDGGIHYWSLKEDKGDRFLTLVCTEDASMQYMKHYVATFRTADAMLDVLRGTSATA